METVSNWRATYVPGRWVLLAGPTSVVVMQPAPPHMSGLLNDLWLDVVSAADVSDLAEKLSAFRLDLMPHFAAFFWAEDGMHSLIRGGLRAVDAETGDVVAEGEGFRTWNEVGLQSIKQVRVDMDELDDEPVLRLPLGVGIVLAASVTIDATQTVQLVLPTARTAASDDAPGEAEDTDILPTDEQYVAEPSVPIDTREQRPEDESSSEASAPLTPSRPASPGPAAPPGGDAWGVRDAEPVELVDLFVDEDGDGVPDVEQGVLDLEPQSAAASAEALTLEVPSVEPVQDEGFRGRSQAAPPTYPPPQAPGQSGQAYPGQPFPGQPFPGQPLPGQPLPGQYGPPQRPYYPPSPQYGGPASEYRGPLTSPVPPPAAYAPSTPSAPPPQASGAHSGPGLPVSGDSADSDGTVFSPGIATTHKPVGPRQGSDKLVLAVVCSFGHPNPPGSSQCRRCGQPVGDARPRLVRPPVMAQLTTAGGARVELTDTVLIGRAPSAQAGEGNAILLPVPSPNSDISRTHLKVAVKDWDIVATDLHSTNGTMLVRPGQAPVRMVPGTPVTVEPGTILDLGDGGVITVGLPA